MARDGKLSVRGFQLHLTHYDPNWIRKKSREKRFDLDLALEVVESMSRVGINLLVVDCADGVVYKSHPELRRPYSADMKALQTIAKRAATLGIEVVPKLNFSQGSEEHNLWFRPHNFPFDTSEYWRKATELIDELIGVCQPGRFFHIGMDEDFGRSHAQYVKAILTLRSILKQRHLRAVVWNDAATMDGPHEVFGEKCLFAETKIPKDVVQVPWCYSFTQPKTVTRLVKRGFDVWGAPAPKIEQAESWKKDLLRYGGKGILLTRWIPCRPGNRKELLRVINTVGAVL
jgi:hypothetical protein